MTKYNIIPRSLAGLTLYSFIFFSPCHVNAVSHEPSGSSEIKKQDGAALKSTDPRAYSEKKSGGPKGTARDEQKKTESSARADHGAGGDGGEPAGAPGKKLNAKTTDDNGWEYFADYYRRLSSNGKEQSKSAGPGIKKTAAKKKTVAKKTAPVKKAEPVKAAVVLAAPKITPVAPAAVKSPEDKVAAKTGKISAEKNFRGMNLAGSNLQGADLSGADLYMANLEKANLERVNLQGANLEMANLKGANLRSASMKGAAIFMANLENADLQGADLRGVYAAGANLSGANLNSAQLRGAVFFGANLKNADLKNVNLDEAEFDGSRPEIASLSTQGKDALRKLLLDLQMP